MSSVSELGIRVALIGGKAAAAESYEVAKSIGSIGTEAELTGAKAVRASAGIDMLGASSKGLTDSNIGLTMSYKDLMASTSEVSLDTEILMVKVGELIPEMDAYAAALGRANVEQNIFGAAVTRSGAEGELAGAKLKKFGGAIGAAVGAAAVFVGVESVKMAVAFSESTASIAASANISVKQAGLISNAFLHTAGTVGFSGTEITNAFGKVAGQLSSITGKVYDTRDSVKFMKVSMDLATASGQDLTASTASLASVMQVFHYSVGQAAQAANTLYNTGRLTNTSTMQLVTVMDMLHSRLQQVMPSLKDVSSLTLDLADHGAKGARGTFMVSGALTTLLSGSQGVNAMLETLGLSSQAFIGPNGKFIGMRNAIAILQPKLASLAPNLQLMAEKALFGAGAAQLMGATVLSGAKYFDKTTAAVTRHGVMIAAAAKQDASYAGEIKTVNSAIHDWMIMLGNWLLPKLIALGKWMAHHKGVMAAIGIVVGVVLVAAFYMWASSMIAAAIAAVTMEGAITMGLSVAIIALVAGIIWLGYNWRHIWTDIKNWTGDGINFVERIFNDVLKFFKKLPGEILNIGKYLVDAYEWPYVEAFNFIIKMYNDTIGQLPAWLGGGKLNVIHTTFAGGPGGVSLHHGGTSSSSNHHHAGHGAPMLVTPGSNIATSSTGNFGPRESPAMAGLVAGGTPAAVANAAVVPSQLIAGQPGGKGQPTVVQVVVDRKVLAETVYHQLRDEFARR